MNANKSLNSSLRDRALPAADSHPHLNVLLYDPLGEYKLVEKLEMEEQKKNENKIQNKDQKTDNDDKVSQKPTSEIGGNAGSTTGNPQANIKKKKAVFDDVESLLTSTLKSIEFCSRISKKS